MKNDAPITNLSYYTLIYFSVVIYYTHAYINDRQIIDNSNTRSQWYYQNKKLVFATQVIYTIIVIVIVALMGFRYISSFKKLILFNYLLLLVFPLIAFLYYNSVSPKKSRFRMRNIAWLKPFLIGFVCTGAIVVYPLVFHAIEKGTDFRVSLENGCYFITNWLFTTAIAIMFDIKDFAADHNYHLQTFVVTKGLRHTIFFILLPLSAASYISFIVFAVVKHFSALQVIINTIPFLLLLVVSASLRRRRGILYYLIVIDGLLLIKASFGIITMTLIK